MRIGLIRHFKVEEGLPKGWRTAMELHEWRGRYDLAQVIPSTLDVGANGWSQCISSDMERAVATAKAAFTGTIEFTPLLREAEFAPFQTGALRLPTWLWRHIYRLAWMSGHSSQRMFRDEFRSRVMAVADRLEALKENVLVVSHAGMMIYLTKELALRGFIGPKLRMPENARLYVYEKGA